MDDVSVAVPADSLPGLAAECHVVDVVVQCRPSHENHNKGHRRNRDDLIQREWACAKGAVGGAQDVVTCRPTFGRHCFIPERLVELGLGFDVAGYLEGAAVGGNTETHDLRLDVGA